MVSRFPDFIVLGAPKAGTTSLYFYLKQHPQIFLPSIKEPGFFAFENVNMNAFHYYKDMNIRTATVTERAKYASLYADARQDQVTGDMSTIYLSSPIAPATIKKYAPNAKLIAILRNPVDRAFSNFTHLRNDELEPARDLLAAVSLEERRIEQNWYPFYHYIKAGMYSQQLERYYEFFPKEQIKILFYEDLKQMDTTLVEIFRFIGVDPSVSIDSSVKFNTTGKIPRFPSLHRLLRGDKSYKKGLKGKVAVTKWAALHAIYDKIMLGEPAKMTTEERRVLTKIFEADIKKTADLLGKNLDHWLKG